MQSEATYIGHIQETVDQWVALHPILKVYTSNKGYGGGGMQEGIMLVTGDTRKLSQVNL